jgi:hypothetical protein
MLWECYKDFCFPRTSDMFPWALKSMLTCEDHQPNTHSSGKMALGSSSQEMGTRSQQPETESKEPGILQQIEQLDFSKPLEVSKFVTLRLYSPPRMLDLAENDYVKYAVLFGGVYMSTSDRVSGSKGLDDLSDYIFEIQQSTSTSKRPTPKFIFEVGELFMKDKTRNWTGLEPTNFFLVIDIISRKKTPWIIYDYKPLNGLGEREPISLEEDNILIRRLNPKKLFDCAQVSGQWMPLTVESLEKMITQNCQEVHLSVTPASETGLTKAFQEVRVDSSPKEAETESNKFKPLFDGLSDAQPSRISRIRSLSKSRKRPSFSFANLSIFVDRRTPATARG